jgi:hypothetical protein
VCHNSLHVAPWLVAPPCWWAFHLPHLHAAPKDFHVTKCKWYHSLQQPYFDNVTFSIPMKRLKKVKRSFLQQCSCTQNSKVWWTWTSPPVAIFVIININLLRMKNGYHVGIHVEMAPTHCHIHTWIQKVDVGIYFFPTNWAHFSPPQTLNKHQESEMSHQSPCILSDFHLMVIDSPKIV